MSGVKKVLQGGKLYVTWVLVPVQSQLSHTSCKIFFCSSKNKSVFVETWRKKPDGVGPVDNRLSTDKLHLIAREKNK